MAAKYQKEAEEHLKLLFHEPWMTEIEWAEFLEHLFKQTGTSYEDMSNKIQQGIDQGITIAVQQEIIKALAPIIRKGEDFEKKRI